MTNKKKDLTTVVSQRKLFSIWKLILPVVIGLGMVAFMFWKDTEKGDLALIWNSMHFTTGTWFCLALAFLFIFGRDFGLSWRFRALTNKQLSWKNAYEVDMLCEFASCVTPSAVGGSSFGMIFLNTKGIEFGRAAALMVTTLFMDELFFVIFCPIVALLTPVNEIFGSAETGFSFGIRLTFWLIYTGIFIWTTILFTGLILRPQWIKSVIGRVFRWRILRRWQDQANSLGDNIVATSKDLRNRSFRFWIEIFIATVLSWFSRYLVVNALFFGFIPGSESWQWVIFARQLVIWVVLMIGPTPGGSGISEWLFSECYGDIIPSVGMALVLAVIWRIVSYYLYLLIGAVIVPGWLKNSLEKFHPNVLGKRKRALSVNSE